MNASGVALIADDDEFFRIALGFILKSKLRFTEIIETGS
ncbi:DNA-binding response regulator, partial [Sinorhizobium meliloti]